jgi:hypothetical protein
MAIQYKEYKMSFLQSMYARRQAAMQDKNPNRVLGGLKGHGADHYSIIGEDGADRQVPTRAYVQGLEDKVRKLEERLNDAEKKIRKISS